jgi:segregation and condensation protein B
MSIAPVQPMTLGRFVRVTLQNFRLLISTFSGSDPSAAMPTTTNTDQESQAPIVEEALPANDAAIDRAEIKTNNDDALDAGKKTIQATMQPALDLPTDADQVIVTAETESGELLVRVGEAALTMQSALESLLFVADAPVEAAQLARVVNAPVEVVETHLRRMDELLRTQARGLRVAERNGRFQMVTAPAAASLIEAFLNFDMTTRLSAPALETLAIVAYRQPVTRAQIEAVRGVDCSGVLRSLVQRGLIEEVDRLDAPGRPVRYGVTDLFMHHFGLTTMQELPPLPEAESEQIDSALAREE